MENQTEVRPVVSGSVMKLLEYLLYVTCTGFHVLYAHDQVPEVEDRCLIWMLACGAVMIAVMLIMKNDVWQQIIIITLATTTTFVVGYWVHTMEFGLTVYLVMGIMVAWLQKPVLNIISSIEGLLAMILAYVCFKDVILEKVSGLFYLTMTIIGAFAMASICYMVIRYRKQVAFIEEQKQSLIQAQKSKDMFFANMSHEIRTPMNAVVGMCELILREPNLSDTVRENAVGIRNSGKNLLAIINDILDFSKIESGKLYYAQESYSLSSVINDVVAMAMVRKGKKPIEVLVDCDSNMPAVLIGDEMRIRQIITNLMGNAVKFTKEGRIKLTLRSEKSGTGVLLRVVVSDTGIGIREEDLKLLFEAFMRLDAKKNSSVEGTGLGLAITKRLVEGMHGELTITSKYGEGSEFGFFIPQGVADRKPIVHLRQPKKEYHILLIPDFERISNESVRQEYGEFLERLIAQLGIRGYMVTDEKTRQQQIVSILEQDPEADYTHIFISGYEYQANEQLYDRLAEEIQICVVIERDTVFHGGKNIRIIYKPMYLLTMVAILNGESVTGLSKKREQERIRFIAPACKVLAVDDNMVNLQVIKGLLKTYRIEVDTVESAGEALAEMRNGKYDLVLMDHMMPVMDGMEAVEKIRADKEHYDQNIPIIALTANAVNGAKNMFLKNGFQDFIAKPIEIAALEHVLLSWLPKDKVELQEGQMNAIRMKPEDEDDSIYHFETIDEKVGLSYFANQRADYEDILRIFYEGGKKKQIELRDAYETGNMQAYMIQVHSLKSTALNIGAVRLSEMAKNQEVAARSSRLEEVIQNHDSMMEEYRLVLQDIEKVL